VFPNLYSHSFNNVLNAVALRYKAKQLAFFYPFSKKNSFLVHFINKNKLIDNYKIIKKKNNFFFFIKLLYYKNLQIFKNFKFFTKKTQIFFISIKALKALNKRSGSSIFLISTSRGLVTHKEALSLGTSGYLIGSFFN
jgi:ribosomal protein S8